MTGELEAKRKGKNEKGKRLTRLAGERWTRLGSKARDPGGRP